MESDDTLKAEIAAWRKAAEDAHAWGDEMREVMLAALFGTDRSGRNAAIERILREWAVEQIDAFPDAKNYLELGLDYTESTPGVCVLVTIRREDGETPAGRASRLLAERDAAVARAEAAEAALLKARSAGARAEREAVIKHIRTHPDVADRRGGQHVGTGPNPSVQRFMLRILIPDLECGAHVPEPS